LKFNNVNTKVDVINDSSGVWYPFFGTRCWKPKAETSVIVQRYRLLRQAVGLIDAEVKK